MCGTGSCPGRQLSLNASSRPVSRHCWYSMGRVEARLVFMRSARLRPRRVFLIKRPLSQVVRNVQPDRVQLGRVADYVFIVVALPELAREGWPAQGLDAANVFIGGHGFEPLHDRGEAGARVP